MRVLSHTVSRHIDILCSEGKRSSTGQRLSLAVTQSASVVEEKPFYQSDCGYSFGIVIMMSKLPTNNCKDSIFEKYISRAPH